MPAKDAYHDTVKIALIKDSWVITDDPLKLKVGDRSLYADLGAKKIFAAEKKGRKIAVEIKSFLDPSPISELEKAIGQYDLYSFILEDEEPDRTLYLAISTIIFDGLFSEAVGQLVLKKKHLNLIVFDVVKQEILQWIP